MLITDKVIVVTGGGNGIGRALCRRFAADTPRAIVVADLDGDAARRVAGEVRGTARDADVTCEGDIQRLVAETMQQHGRIDLFCSNAGIANNGDRGIRVSALCPQGVRTDMLMRAEAEDRSFLIDGAVEPEYVAELVVQGIADERFLILPHPEVAEYVRRKATDHERWLRGMRRLARPLQN